MTRIGERELATRRLPGRPGATARRLLALALAAGAVLIALGMRGGFQPAPNPAPGLAGEARAERAYGELPLAFEPNSGRAPRRIDYIARAGASTALLGSRGATVELPSRVLRISLVGATSATPAAVDRLPGVVNSLVGDDPSRWRTGIPTFERVRYAEVWPGVDVEWYGNRRRLEYDFNVAPRIDPRRIAIRFSGQDSIRLSPTGGLLLRAGGQTIRQPAPLAYQPSSTGRERVPAGYVLDGHTARLSLGAFDRSRPLVIDPLIYLAVVGDVATGAGAGPLNPITDVAVDSGGNAYLTGGASQSSYPTTQGALDTHLDGTGVPAEGTFADAFVTKLNPSGSAAVYSTYLGGTSTESGSGIAIDSAGEAFVTGETASSDFPTTATLDQSLGGTSDTFVTRLNAAGSALVWSTFLGGGGKDSGAGVAVGPAGGDPVVVGTTTSTNFPTADAQTSAPCDLQEADPDGTSATDAFYAGFDSGGNRICSSYLGGDGADSASDVAIGLDGSTEVGLGVVGSTDSTDLPVTGNAFQGSAQGGRDAWALRISFPAGFLTYFGGDGDDSATGVAIDSDAGLYLTGSTDSNVDDGGGDFPVTAGSLQDSDPEPDGLDGFVATFLNTLSGAPLDYSSLLGGSSGDAPAAVAVDSSGAAYVAGSTQSADFPTTPRAVDTTPSGSGDAFLTKLTPDGSGLTYGTFLSGGGSDSVSGLALDSAGAAYLTGGTTAGLGQPVTAGTFDDPAGSFVAKVTALPRPDVRCQGKSATSVGTNGRDLLIGTNGPDVFAGLGGLDRIVGIAGNDIACGGGGNDVIDGGPGKDRLNGQGGKDTLKGGGGRDKLKGGGGRDRCVGGGGRDRARSCERRRSI